MSNRVLIPLVACVACLASVAFILVDRGAQPDEIAAVGVAFDATTRGASFRLERLGGGQIDSADLHGSIVVLDIWATWCGPCLPEIPRYDQVQRDYRGQGVSVLGVAVDSGSPRAIAHTLARLQPISYPMALGSGDFERGFGPLWGLPTTILLDRDWNVRKVWTGARPGKHEQIRNLIDQLLAAEARSD